MKLLLLTLLVIGVSAKDKTKDKDVIHELIYKDENVLNFGEVGKVKIHQRLDNLNIDATQRHLLNDVSVNVDRCISTFNDDYKTNKDVQKYRYSVGNLVGIVLGQLDYLDRNNQFNNVGFIDNLINRLRLCDVVIRESDILNQKVDWRGWNRDTWNRDSWNRDTINRDVDVNRNTGRFLDTNVYRGGVNVYRDTDRDLDTNTYRGGLDRGDIYGRRVGDNVNRIGGGYDLNNGRFQRSLNVDSNLDNDLGIVGWYRIIYGLVNDDERDRDLGVNRDKNVYGYNWNRFDKNRDTYGNYGINRFNRFDKNRDINGDYDYNRLNRDRGYYGTNRYDYYRNVFGSNRNDDDQVLYNNNNWNRYDTDRDIYGHGGDYRNDRYDIDNYGRRDLNLIGGGDRDVVGRRTGYYNTDTNRRDYNDYNKYLVGGRDNRLDTYVD